VFGCVGFFCFSQHRFRKEVGHVDEYEISEKKHDMASEGASPLALAHPSDHF
jgi:hypothetical protein